MFKHKPPDKVGVFEPYIQVHFRDRLCSGTSVHAVLPARGSTPLPAPVLLLAPGDNYLQTT